MNANVTKTNGVKLLAAILAIAIAFTGVVMLTSDDSSNVDAATGTQVYGGETLNETQEFNNVSIRVIDDLVIGENGVLIINGGNFTVDPEVEVEITDGGRLIIGSVTFEEGEISSVEASGALVTINGSVYVTGEGSEIQVNVTADSTYKNSGIVINESVEVAGGGAFKAADGATAQSILVANGGTLDVYRSSGKVGSLEGIDVQIAVGGTFNFNGVSGADSFKVSTYSSGAIYTTSSAEITAPSAGKESYSDLTFTVSNQNVSGYEIKEDADDAVPVTIRQYNLNVNGSVADGDSITFSGAQGGTVSEGAYKPVVYFTSPEYAEAYFPLSSSISTMNMSEFMYDSLVLPKVTISDLRVNAGASVTVNGGSNTYDAVLAIVTGTLNLGYEDVADSSDKYGKLTVNGILALQGTATASKADCVQAGTGIIAIDGGSATVRDTGYNHNLSIQLYGAYYVDESGATDVLYITDLASAITGAAAVNQSRVVLYATSGSEDNDGLGGYAISADLTIPEGIELEINNAVIIDEDVTVTIADGGEINFGGDITTTSPGIHVNGTLVDNDTGLDETKMVFEVMIETESGRDLIRTFTTLDNALTIVTSGTIYLYNSVDIDGTLTIPANVTVQFHEDAADNSLITVKKDGTLVIDGTLVLASYSATATDGTGTELKVETDGTVRVNNMIVVDNVNTVVTNKTIPGAYFVADLDDEGDNMYITSAAVAATNSASIDGIITIYGSVSMGDVTFTKGEDSTGLKVEIVNIYDATNYKNVQANGTVTLVGEVTFDMTNGAFTGTVTSETTAGTTAVSFEKSKGAIVAIDATENVDSTTTEMLISGTTVVGGVTIASGEVTTASAITMSNSEDETGVLTVATGATFNVEDELKLAAPGKASDIITEIMQSSITEYLVENATFVVDGTVNVENAAIRWGYSIINGDLNILKNGSLAVTLMQVDGNVVVAEDASESNAEIMLVFGTLSGKMKIASVSTEIGGAILEFPDSTMTDAKIQWNDTNAETEAKVTGMYINGELYATVYTVGEIPVQYLYLSATTSGLDKDSADVKYYSDEAMTRDITSKVNDDTKPAMIGAYDNVYATVPASTVVVAITVYQGMDLYIDGKAIQNFYSEAQKGYVLSVGQHTFAVQIDPGLTGTYEVTLNGQAVDGTFTITDDAKEFQIVVTGNLTQESVVVDQGGSSDSGMGLTDYLLIVLVILIVVMAIMVAMRLMRS